MKLDFEEGVSSHHALEVSIMAQKYFTEPVLFDPAHSHYAAIVAS